MVTEARIKAFTIALNKLKKTLGGEFQTETGKTFTYSDTIDKLIKFYRENKKL